MKLKIGKGVLGKDSLPWAAKTIHAVNTEGWNMPCEYTMARLCRLIVDTKIVEITIIDDDNSEFTLTK